MYKLLALDIDGTLINDNLKVTNPTRQAIEVAQGQGVMITLATGRSFHSTKYYADKLKIDLPLICANGALIRSRDGHVFKETTFAREKVAPLLKAMGESGLFVQAYHQGGISTTGSRIGLLKWVDFICAKNLKLNYLLYSIKEYWRSKLNYCPQLPQMLASGELSVHKLFSSGKPEQLAPFQRRALAMGLSVEYYPGNKERMYLEIMPAGTSKGAALNWLADYLGVSMEQVVAVGDNLNDSAMVTAAGLGVAMGNGHSELKALAGHITLSNDEDGVAAVIRDFFLIPDKPREAI